jgi:hypothetical protein
MGCGAVFLRRRVKQGYTSMDKKKAGLHLWDGVRSKAPFNEN